MEISHVMVYTVSSVYCTWNYNRNRMVTLNQSWCIIKRHYGLFLPISQEANICFFASISILTSIIKFFYDKKHKNLDTLWWTQGIHVLKEKNLRSVTILLTARGNYLLVIHSGQLRRYTMKTTLREQSYCYRHARNNT